MRRVWTVHRHPSRDPRNSATPTAVEASGGVEKRPPHGHHPHHPGPASPPPTSSPSAASPSPASPAPRGATARTPSTRGCATTLRGLRGQPARHRGRGRPGVPDGAGRARGRRRGRRRHVRRARPGQRRGGARLWRPARLAAPLDRRRLRLPPRRSSTPERPARGSSPAGCPIMFHTRRTGRRAPTRCAASSRGRGRSPGPPDATAAGVPSAGRTLPPGCTIVGSPAWEPHTPQEAAPPCPRRPPTTRPAPPTTSSPASRRTSTTPATSCAGCARPPSGSTCRPRPTPSTPLPRPRPRPSRRLAPGRPRTTLFFGRIDCRTEHGGENLPRRASHVGDAHGDPVVVDWRAPHLDRVLPRLPAEPMGVELRRVRGRPRPPHRVRGRAARRR